MLLVFGPRFSGFTLADSRTLEIAHRGAITVRDTMSRFLDEQDDTRHF